MNYPLRQCVWEITLQCCFSCKYCGSRGGRARENELTAEECFRIAGEMAALGVRRVSMIGGEVFMRPDWAEIARHITDNGISLNLITNGFSITEDIVRALREARVESVSVSIDGPQAVHDAFRQAGSYQRALCALDTLCAHGIPASVISTLNAKNVPQLPSLLETLKGYPIYAWQLQACSPMGNAARGGVDLRFDFAQVIDFVQSHMRTAPFALGIADNIGYFTPGEGFLRGNLSGRACFAGCRAGITAVGIDSAGNVRGCESMYDDRFIEGNLRQKSLREIWEDPGAFAYNRAFKPTLLTGKCAACEMGRYCAGGCRSYNYFVHGKLYESPFCARQGPGAAE